MNLASISRLAILALALIVCGCAEQSAAPIVTPSPTIALSARQSSPTGLPAPTSTRPPARTEPTTPPPLTTEPTVTPPRAESFVYLWPAYLPADMRVSPGESRVAREGETGQNAAGFFIVTFTAAGGKLVIGGGATDMLPLAGDQRRITVGGRAATLTTSAAGRQIVFDVPKGSLFVYSSALSEEELLRVAGSLQPIELAELRKRVGAE